MTATETASRRVAEEKGKVTSCSRRDGAARLVPLPGRSPSRRDPLLAFSSFSLYFFLSALPSFLPSSFCPPSLPLSPLSPFCRFRWPRIIWPQKVEEARENGTRKIWPRVSVTITKRRGAVAAAGRIRRVLSLAPVLLDNRGGGAGQGPSVVVRPPIRPSVQETSTFLSLSLSLLPDNDLQLQGH